MSLFPRTVGRGLMCRTAARIAATAILCGCAGARAAPPPCGPSEESVSLPRGLTWRAPGRVPSSVPMAINLGCDRVLLTWVTRKEIPAAENRFLSEVWLAVVGPGSNSLEATPVLTFRSYETLISVVETSPPLLVVAHSWQLECYQIRLPDDGGPPVVSPVLTIPSATPRALHAAAIDQTLCIVRSEGSYASSLLAFRRSSAGLDQAWNLDLSQRGLPHSLPSSVIAFGDAFMVTLTSWDSEWERYEREVLRVDVETGLVRGRCLLESGSLDALDADRRGSRLPFDEDSISTAAGPDLILVACLSVQPGRPRQSWLYEVGRDAESVTRFGVPAEGDPEESLRICSLPSTGENRVVVAGVTALGNCSTRIMVKNGTNWSSKPLVFGPARVGPGPGLGLTAHGSRLLLAWSGCASGHATVELASGRVK